MNQRKADYLKLKLGVLVAVAGLALAAALLAPPLPQDPGYHDFADRRSVLGIPNFWNVASNLPFALVGWWGVREARRRRLKGGLPELRPAYLVFFVGVALVAVGSGYYHWRPSNGSLVWDRLPMTLGFMAFFAALIGENISLDAARRLLGPFLTAGLLSVLYWHFTELQGRGDLRPYALVQFLPLLLTPVILLLFDSPWKSNGWIWAALGLYGLSKASEVADRTIFEALGAVSGHTIKHLLAAAGATAFLAAIRGRVQVTEP